MLIPYGTDAPLYRPPIGTLSLITANVLLFCIQDSITPESLYVLHFGNGLNPIQWILSAFAHGNFWHLLGNMIFLFSFGLIVESMMKLRHFLALYFAIVIIEAVAIQVAFLGGSGGALGASGAIYGLIAVSCLCAPGKNVKWLFIFFLRSFFFEVPVLITGLFYILMDVGSAGMNDFAMSTPFLHSCGALVGVACGVGAYHLKWFELDGEDLFSRMREIAGKEPVISEFHKERIKAAELGKPVVRKFQFGPLETQVEKLNQHITQERYKLAMMKLKQLRTEHGKFRMSERQLLALIQQGTSNKDFANVIVLMDDYIARFETHRISVCLNKARIQLVELNDMAAARTTIEGFSPSKLSQRQRKVYFQLKRRLGYQATEEKARKTPKPHFPVASDSPTGSVS